ncbi:MAG: type II and III secretion system protein family protein, partial [Candidatus Sericytochromatia bacterium]
MVWTKNGGAKSYDITVGLDAKQVEKQVHSITGNDMLRVAFNGGSFMISGPAQSIAQREMAEKIVSAYGQPVVNLVQMPQRLEQIQIDVQVVELSRTAALNLGWNVGGGEIKAIQNGVRQYIFKPGDMMLGEAQTGVINTFGQIDFLALQIEAMQRRGLAKVLANPTLVTTDGGTATFLAGGEIPIPIQQALGTTTIQWKEFGVRLAVAPQITAAGRISMKVAPEVSSLDYANGLKSATFNIPSIKTRRAETSVVLAPQETLMLGGLLNNEEHRSWAGLPGLADIPVLGHLFRSREWLDNQTELAIFVSPRMITATAGVQLPTENLQKTHQELRQELMEKQ